MYDNIFMFISFSNLKIEEEVKRKAENDLKNEN